MTSVSIPAVLHPKNNPTGYMAAAGALYAAAVMIYNARYHHGIIDVPVIVSAIAAVSALLTRQIVTPVAAPRDGAGNPLVPAPVPPADDSGNVRVLPPPGWTSPEPPGS